MAAIPIGGKTKAGRRARSTECGVRVTYALPRMFPEPITTISYC